MSSRKYSDRKWPFGESTSRREFLRTAAVLAGSAMLPGGHALADTRSGNIMPGRIAIREDRDASTGSTVHLDVIKNMVDDSLRSLSGETDPVMALESFFPGLDTTKKITFKVNIISPSVPTRWEMVRALTDRMTQMLGGTFPAGNITIFDDIPSNISSTMAGCGFTAEHFPGMHIYDTRNTDPNTSIWVGDTYLTLSSHIVDCDYLINCPVLKNHSQSGKYWTLAFKNHIGSVSPMNCHAYEPRMLTLAGSPHIRDKTKLVALSGVHGIYVNGPEGPAQSWQLFPEEHMPNLIMLSTDPVTLEHWGIHLINEERALHGITVHSDAYCQNAGESPYNLGTYPFSEQQILTALQAPTDLTVVRDGSSVRLEWTPVPGAQRYNIYRSNDPGFIPDPWGETNLHAETTETFFTDTLGIGAGDGYYYVVRAFRVAWESEDSHRVGAFRFPW